MKEIERKSETGEYPSRYLSFICKLTKTEEKENVFQRKEDAITRAISGQKKKSLSASQQTKWTKTIHAAFLQPDDKHDAVWHTCSPAPSPLSHTLKYN